MQERQLALGRNDEESVRLRHGARHLGEELRAGDAHGEGQPDPLARPLPQADGDLPRCAGDPLHAADVEERLVDRQPLDGRRRVLEQGVESLARLGVGGHPRRDDDRVRAEPERPAPTHRRPHAVRLRLVARREHDAAADDHRASAQGGRVALLDGREEGVRIGMQNGRRRHEHMFP